MLGDAPERGLLGDAPERGLLGPIQPHRRLPVAPDEIRDWLDGYAPGALDILGGRP